MTGRTSPWKLSLIVLLFAVPLVAVLFFSPRDGGAMPDSTTHAVDAASGGFVHAVYFWLRPDLSAQERESFVQGLESLRGIESVRHGWIGVPAGTDRPIIDRSYSYALTVVFADDAGHEVYQVHPVHDRFREQFAGYWTRVQIYDSIEQPAGAR